MQNNFNNQESIEDILNQVRQKKQTHGMNATDNTSSERKYEPVFKPEYKENSDINFSTPPAVKIPSTERQKPRGPVFGAKPPEPVKEIPIPPPAHNKGHGVVTGLLGELGNPPPNKEAVASKEASYPLTQQEYISQQQQVQPSSDGKGHGVITGLLGDLERPTKQQASRTPTPPVPPAPTPPIPAVATTPIENKSVSDTPVQQPLNTPTAPTPIAKPVASETFTPPKKKKSTTTFIPKERVITKEVNKPTFQSLKELENRMSSMEYADTTEESASNIQNDNLTRTGSIRVEALGDERFYEFFSSTVAMDKEALKDAVKGKKRKRTMRNYFNTTSINTGDVPRSDAFVPPQEEQVIEEVIEDIDVEDYNDLTDASGILQDLKRMTRFAFFRFFVVTLIAGAVTYLSTALFYVSPLPSVFLGDGGDLVIYYTLLGLMTLSVLVAFPTFGRGFTGLFTIPTQDSFVFISILGAAAQISVLAIMQASPIAEDVTIFAPFAMLAYVINALGRWLQLRGITTNFSIASEGFDHSAAYLVKNREAVLKLTAGIKEEYPELLLSRPTALVKNFLRQSFSPHESDRNGKRYGIIILLTSIASALITYYLTQGNLVTVISVFAAVLVIASPLASIFVQVLPTVLMNKSASRVGAIIPGWEAIEGIGKTTAVMLNAHDIFPPTTVRLHAIKTFNKDQRIDLAILYAASVLTNACATLRDIFLSMIEGKTEMLFEVESLTNEVGYGFTAWVDGKRINIGNRDLMEKHNIPLPSMDFESRFSKSERSVIYLAVSGTLYCMFLVSYVADEDIAMTLNILRQSEVSLLIRSDDFNITSELVSQKFEISPENLKVLNGKEDEIAQRYTNYLPDSEGIMTHFGTFSSFIGGLRAASAAESAERMASVLQTITVLISLMIAVVLSVTMGLHGLHSAIILAYQIMWMVITILVITIKRY